MQLKLTKQNLSCKRNFVAYLVGRARAAFFRGSGRFFLSCLWSFRFWVPKVHNEIYQVLGTCTLVVGRKFAFEDKSDLVIIEFFRFGYSGIRKFSRIKVEFWVSRCSSIICRFSGTLG